MATSYSTCNACRQGCDPTEKSHTTRLGSRGPGKGCGIEFTHICTPSTVPVSKLVTREMRPDLEFIDSPGPKALVHYPDGTSKVITLYFPHPWEGQIIADGWQVTKVAPGEDDGAGVRVDYQISVARPTNQPSETAGA